MQCKLVLHKPISQDKSIIVIPLSASPQEISFLKARKTYGERSGKDHLLRTTEVILIFKLISALRKYFFHVQHTGSIISEV